MHIVFKIGTGSVKNKMWNTPATADTICPHLCNTF